MLFPARTFSYIIHPDEYGKIGRSIERDELAFFSFHFPIPTTIFNFFCCIQSPFYNIFVSIFFTVVVKLPWRNRPGLGIVEYLKLCIGQSR